MKYLSLCLIVKDEDEDYLREWVDYHTRIGVEYFIIYDNQSAVPVRETLADVVAQGRAVVLDIHGKYMQDPAYTHCRNCIGNASRWIGFLDADEFIFPKTQDDLREFLRDYEAYGGLAVNWSVFGSSGYTEKPAGMQIEHFIYRVPNNPRGRGLVKSIVQPQHVINLQTPHAFFYEHGFPCVGENFDVVEQSFRPVSTAKIQINHYVLRSRTQFLKKLERGRADHGQSAYHRLEYFDETDQECVIEDRGIFALYQRRSAAAPPAPDQPREQGTPALPPDIFSPAQLDFLRFSQTAAKAEQRQDWQTLAAVYQIAVQKYPDILETYLLLAGLLSRRADAHAAQEWLRRALALDPTSIAAQKMLAESLHQQGKAYDAPPVLEGSINVQAPDVEALIGMGEVYLAQQRYQNAAECFDTALRHSPWNQAAWQGMLHVLYAAHQG